MKYIRDRLNYFRQDEARIEDTKKFYAAVKEQNDNEPIPPVERASRIKFVLLSLCVVVVLVLIVAFIFNTVNSLDNPDEIFENTAVLYSFVGCFMVVGLLFSVIPIVNGIRLKIKCTEETYATCIGYDDTIVTNKHGAHFESCPVYRFTDSGNEYTVYDKKYVSYLGNLPEIGSSEQVLYDREDPNCCIIANRVNWKILSIVVGAIFLFLGLVFYFGVLSGL